MCHPPTAQLVFRLEKQTADFVSNKGIYKFSILVRWFGIRFPSINYKAKNNKPAHMTMARIKASRQSHRSVLSALDKRCDFVDF